MWSKSLSVLIIILLMSSCQKDMLTWELEQLPKIEISAEAISPNKVHISYSIISESPATALRINWRKATSPGVQSGYKDVAFPGDEGDIIISGLCEESLYYLTAEAENEVGTNISNENEILTLSLTGELKPILAFKADTTDIFPGESVNFSNLSSNVSCEAEWEWYVNDSLFSVDFNSSFFFSRPGVFSITLLKHFGGQTFELEIENYITVNGPNYPPGATHCSEGGAVVLDVLNPATGRIWMDRNIGASRVATTIDDEDAFGDLYQWGRFSDGHQCRDTETTSTLSSTTQPGHGEFITTSGDPNDWLYPQNDNLWQSLTGGNNPCPEKYRIPTVSELDAERESWSSNNQVGAFNSPLRLPAAGLRTNVSGELFNDVSYGNYWSSTVSGTYVLYLHVGSSNAGLNSNYRGLGYSVRCIKE